MKPLIYLLMLFTALSLHASSTTCQGIYFSNTAPDILNTKFKSKTTEICYTQFALLHSGISKTPLWSAEHLTRAMLQHEAKRSEDFHADEHLGHNDRAELEDYKHSGYDRGHMSPSGDFDNMKSNEECFTLANMIPQNHENNEGIWSDIEKATRSLAKKQGEVYVITGPIFTGSHFSRIGGRVYIPPKIFKAIYIPSTGQAAAYVTDNAPGYRYDILSIAELEKLTGIEVFPFMAQSAKMYAARLPDPKDFHKDYGNHNSYPRNNESDSFFGKLSRKINNFYKER